MVRFVQEPAVETDSAAWYGIIRHVQSNEQVRFTRIEEALNFMASYVSIQLEGGDGQVEREA